MKRLEFDDGGMVHFAYEPEETYLPHNLYITTGDGVTLRISFVGQNRVTIYLVESLNEEELPGQLVHRDMGTFTLTEIAQILEYAKTSNSGVQTA